MSKRYWLSLSKEERHIIHCRRARLMTGFDVHNAERVGPGYYIWRMGCQPSNAWIEKYRRPTPVEAARAFLVDYMSFEEAGLNRNGSPYVDPVKRSRK